MILTFFANEGIISLINRHFQLKVIKDITLIFFISATSHYTVFYSISFSRPRLKVFQRERPAKIYHLKMDPPPPPRWLTNIST
jgi:hypothetical protein